MDKHSSKISLVLIVTSMLLVSCNSGMRQNPTIDSRTANPYAAVESAGTKQQALASAEQYLQMAAKASPPKRYEYQLLAAQMYIQGKEYSQAQQWIDVTPNNGLSPRLETNKVLLSAELALHQAQPSMTIDQLKKVNASHELNHNQKGQLLELKAQAYDRLGFPLKGAKARAQLDSFLVDTFRKEQNRNALWQALGDVSINDLEDEMQTDDVIFKGWADLALILRQKQIHQLDQRLATWEYQYPRHPASNFMPRNNQDTNKAQTDFPKQIALLLPLTGTHQKAAEAIRDGFLTRYYENEARNVSKPKIQVYDTTSAANAQAIYQKAVQEGADFVVGPLMKQNVLELSKMWRIQVPILALNQNSAIKHPPKDFYQFALAPEDEAEQIAVKAASMNLKNAAIVVPNNNWGARIAEAFSDRWQGLGGHVVSSVKVSSNEDQAKAIRALLNVDNSQQRSTQVKLSIKEKVNFQPRRRKDIDVIVLAAPPEQARQLKPLFNFYFAEDLPVFATSSVYVEKPTPSKDHDMNGIIFCDMPWLLAKDKQSYATRALINQHWPTQANEYARLFAMGIDAYDLSAQIKKLQAYPHSQFLGATGYLSLGADYRIDRQLVWAQFEKGLPTITN